MTYRELKSYASSTAEKRREIEMFIDGIGDPQTRDMFRLRFLLGLKYFQVAMNVGGGISTSGVKMRIYRYVKNSQKN